MLDLLLTPLQYGFMLRSLAAVVLVGVVSAVVGTYVVLRGMAFFGDALAHAILPGVAAGYLLGGGAREPVFWAAMLTAVAAALGINWVTRGAKLKEDTAIGIIFAGMFALGVALISTVQTYTADLTHFLFGDVLSVRTIDLVYIGVFGGIVLLAVIAFYKEFLVLSFDPLLAATLRIPARLLDFLLIVLTAVSIVISLQAVGVALMIAMLVTPAATAYLLTKRMHFMMVLAAALASAAGVIGLYLSYYASIASGAAIVLTATAIFGLVWAGREIKTRLVLRAAS